MSPKPRGVITAGIALLRARNGEVEVLLVHPGGPFWRNKDTNAWSVPKGELDDAEIGPGSPDRHSEANIEAAARREFTEETGHPAPDGPLVPLPELRLGSSSKRLRCFAVLGDLDPDTIVSNTLRPGMAATIGPDHHLSRGGPGGLVHPPGGHREASQGSGPGCRPPARHHRRDTGAPLR